MSAAEGDGWDVVAQTTTPGGHRVEMRYRQFGKGRAKVQKWLIFRDGVKVGYAVTDRDADTNYGLAVRAADDQREEATS